MSRLEASGEAARTVSARCALGSCGREFLYDPRELPRTFPFCSWRCKGVDLGGWVNEEYRVEKHAFPEDEPPVVRGDERETDEDDDES